MKIAIYKTVFEAQTRLITEYRALINLGMYNDRLTVLTEQNIEYELNDAYYRESHLYSAPKNIRAKFWAMVYDRENQTPEDAIKILRQIRQREIRPEIFVSMFWDKSIRAQIDQCSELRPLIAPHLYEHYYYGVKRHSAGIQLHCTYCDFMAMSSLLSDYNLTPDSITIH